MKMSSKHFYLIAIAVLTNLNGWSQEIKIESVFREGDKIILSYDLLDENKEHRYVLSLYCSNDDFIQPLKEVSGDIGVDIPIGGNKQIVWNAKEELGSDFNGNVALELKGKLYVPFVQLNDFQDFDKFKKDRPYAVTWTAGRGSNVLTWDLYNSDDEKVHTFTNIANVGNYELVIPKDIKPGTGYRLKISDQKNNEDVVYTPRFKITRKIPLIVTVGVIGASVTSGYFLYSTLGGETGGEGEEALPDPILPTAIH